MSAIHSQLQKIQAELKAPKNQRNTFGKYNYRSCEDILEAVKPLAGEQGCVVTLTDSIVEVGGRVYVKATATLANSESSISTDAFAREGDQQAGMSPSQITGAASSYARKYALNGLFCIDDTKDADATNDHKKAEVKTEPATPKASFGQIAEIESLLKETHSDKAAVFKYFNVAIDSVPSPAIAAQMITVLKKKLGEMIDSVSSSLPA